MQRTKEAEWALWTWVGQGLIFTMLLVFSAFTLASGVFQTLEGDDEDEATFMMECVYGWGQTPDGCRQILEGQDPPPLPEEEGC